MYNENHEYNFDGNMTTRVAGATTYTQGWDAENHLVSVSGTGLSSTFGYDGDGVRVKGTVNGTATAYVGNWFEWSGSTSTMKKYYYASAQRIAMRTGSGTGTSGLLWMIGDHLGSTTKIANYDGTINSQRRYKPWGEARFGGAMASTFAFTGQRQEVQLGGADGLYYYGARWYDAALGRWLSPDSIVPEGTQGVQAWSRYTYVNNAPTRYQDPTGHEVCDEEGNCYDGNKPVRSFKNHATHPEEAFMKSLRSPLHGEYSYGNYLSNCTTNPCTGIHPGVDSQNIWGEDPPVVVNYLDRGIYAAAPGVVAQVGESDWGNYVMIEHEVGGAKFYSIYAHLNTQTVQAGASVSYNSRIGTMGNTLGTPCPDCTVHLHFEVRKSNNVNLSASDPFGGKVWWPQDQQEFNKYWVGLPASLQ